MLNIQIDNPELEQTLKQTYGNNANIIAEEFCRFLQQQRIRQDISISIEQLDAGHGISLNEAMKKVRAKYE